MKEHKGMRPQDIVILLKVIALEGQGWFNKNVAQQLGISNSEISESLNRSMLSGLLEEDKRTVIKDRLVEFLVFGIKYVFPALPGRISRGVPTAQAAPFLKGEFVTEEIFVWPNNKGKIKGTSIQPLYSTVPDACEKDEHLYRLLALTDALRIGNPDFKDFIAKKLARTIYGAD